MIRIAKDILAGGNIFATADAVVTNSDDSISFKVPTGYLSQEPNVYGLFHIATAIGPYEKFTRLTEMVFTSQTRPQDAQFIYTMANYNVY